MRVLHSLNTEVGSIKHAHWKELPSPKTSPTQYAHYLLSTSSSKAKMRFLTIAALAALTQHVVAEDWKQKLLFHGTSLILRPDYSSHKASNHTATAANFYCYFGQTGYISFGWSVLLLSVPR